MCFLGAVFVAAQFLTTLEPRTIQAFDAYARAVDAEVSARAVHSAPLAGRPQGVFMINAGKDVAHGQIHDWSAVAYLPGVKRSQVIGILEDFSRHAAIYPEVLEGRVERRDGNRIIAFHRVRKKKVLEVNLEASYELDILPATANRYFSRSVATQIVELDGAKRLPPGRDHGFLWRLQTYWTLEETREGLWMEVRSVSLTRDVPAGLGWAVKPIVRDLPRESLEAVMEATKRAALARR
ncbi:MAG: hypothetical protein JNM66_29230 [Bryobacterales bacterium]|nr:hypothetical protein [Bryobacterales bacterium]